MTVFVLPFPAIDPVAIGIGPVSIKWYGLAYIAGIVLGWYYATRIARNQALWGGPPPMTKLQVDDFLIWGAVGIIAGGRLGYVLFYNPVYFFFRPWEIPMLWQGGMSFHGGLMGMILAIVLFARSRQIRVMPLLDVISAVVPIGLFFGRIANFINSELYGRVSDVPWAMVFPRGGPAPRHPSQLYEAGLEGIVLLIVLGILVYRFKALQRPGTISGVFLIFYGLARIFVELFRLPDGHIGYLWGPLTMGMFLSVPMILFGLGFLHHARSHPSDA